MNFLDIYFVGTNNTVNRVIYSTLLLSKQNQSSIKDQQNRVHTKGSFGRKQTNTNIFPIQSKRLFGIFAHNCLFCERCVRVAAAELFFSTLVQIEREKGCKNLPAPFAHARASFE